MSNTNDFIINGDTLVKYTGTGGKVVIPEGVKKIASSAFWLGFLESETTIMIPDSVQIIEKEAFGYTFWGSKMNVFQWLNENVICIKMPDELSKTFTETSLKARFDINQLLYSLLSNPDGFNGVLKEKLFKIIQKNKCAVVTGIVKKSNLIMMSNFLDMQKKVSAEDCVIYNKIIEENSKGQIFNDVINKYQLNRAEPECRNTVSDWRKVFKIKIENDRAIINGYKGENPDLVIPGKIGEYKAIVGEKAFQKLTLLRTVVIGEGVEEISTRAFFECKNLKNVKIPTSLKKIGLGAFERCKALKNIHLSSNVNDISTYAFMGNSDFTIYAPAGSYAETYAKGKNIPFVAE